MTAQVEVTSAWGDQDGADARSGALDAVRPLLGQSGRPVALGSALSRALLLSPTDQPPAPAGSNPDTAAVLDSIAQDLLAALDDAGLVDVRQAPTQRAEEVVLFAPPVPTANQGVVSTPSPSSSAGAAASTAPSAAAPDPSAAPTASEQETVDAATIASWLALAVRLDTSSRGAVVAGPASAALDTGLIAAIRDDSASAAKVSTVDTLGAPMGEVMTVMALQEQFLGRAGAYGFGPGAAAPLPTIDGVAS